MADLPSRSDLFAAGRAYLKQQALTNPNVRITPAIWDVAGSDVNILGGIGSVMGEQLSAAWAQCMKGLFVSTATGAALDRKVYDNFGITRNPAAAATVDVVLRRPTFGAGGGTIAAGTRMSTASGSIFSLQTDVPFGPTDLVKGVTTPISAFAAVVGPDQNIQVNTLTAFVDSTFDPTITVTNPAPAAGGTLAESDAQFRGRALVFFLSIRRGILAAIQLAAQTSDPANTSQTKQYLSGVAVATAFEIVNPGTALPAGAVELVIGDANGNASSLMIQAVKDNLLWYRSAGIPVFVSGGTVVFEAVQYDLDFESGIDTKAASAAVAATAVAMSQFNQPGQPLRRSDLIAAARAVPGVIVTDASLPVPVGDIVPATNSTIIRLRLQDISFG